VFNDTIRVIVEAADEVVAGGAAEAGIQNQTVGIVATEQVNQLPPN
jgi:hypothetical protein